MSSIKCESCGLVNFANAEKCKRCKRPLRAATVAARSNTSFPSPEQSPAGYTPAGVANKTSDWKTTLRVIPFVIFGVPLLLALKDRMFDPPAKVGGAVDTLQMSVLVGCTIGLVIAMIVIVLTRNK